MRYESLPRKITNAITALYKNLKREFGIWAYLIIAFFILLTYKPILRFFDMASSYLLYGILGIVVLFFLWIFLKRLFRRY